MNPNDPAFGSEHEELHGRIRVKIYTPGLSKREWFAGMAMQGLLESFGVHQDVPKWSVEVADALIAELSKEKP